MEPEDLIEHLVDAHGIDPGVAQEVIGGDVGPEAPRGQEGEAYLRGFHDGLHSRVDADDLEGHPRPLWRALQSETESSP